MDHGRAGCGRRVVVGSLGAGVEARDQLGQVAGLRAQVGGGGGGFLDHGGVALGDLVHLVDGGVDLVEAGGLFLRGLGDLGDQAVDLGDLADDAAERLPVSPTSRAPRSTWAVLLAIRVLISLAASAERWARARTSWATTAKPRPASPARAASTPAFSARGWSGRRSRRSRR
jgi:hypothetical protein